jgi:hypothetical protein
MTNDLQGFITENKDSNILINSFLEKHNILNILNRDEQMVAISKVVAEIPWGFGRTIEEVLVSKKVGTCTGKHRVLEKCFSFLNIPHQSVVCTFKWGDQDIKYPSKLQEILNEGKEWSHGHNFVRVEKSNGEKIDVDINWDSHMKKYGFITAESWNGKSDLVAVKKIVDRWDGVSIGEMKIKLIESLSEKQRERRYKFLNGLFEWISSTRLK